MRAERRPNGGSRRNTPGADCTSRPARHQYVFRGLLRCGLCGRAMHAMSDHDRLYYRCRGDDAPDRCPAPMIREDQLLPAVEEIFERLDGYRPDGFADAVAEQSRTRHNPDAAAQVDLTLERLGKRFMWGH